MIDLSNLTLSLALSRKRERERVKNNPLQTAKFHADFEILGPNLFGGFARITGRSQ
jgi:hypothetical protein